MKVLIFSIPPTSLSHQHHSHLHPSSENSFKFKIFNLKSKKLTKINNKNIIRWINIKLKYKFINNK